MTCSKCGNEVNPGGFCSQCGTKAEAAPVQSDPAPVSAPSFAAAPPPPPPMGAPAPMISQQPYAPPPPPQFGAYSPITVVPKVKDYVIVQLLALIPIAGLILMIIWAVGGTDTPLWKSNYARSYFVMMAIGVGLSIVFSIFMFAVMASVLAELGDIFSDFAYSW